MQARACGTAHACSGSPLFPVTSAQQRHTTARSLQLSKNQHSSAAARLARPLLPHRPLSPSALTRLIKRCSDWEQLGSLYLGQRKHLNTINLLAVVHQLAKVSHRRKQTLFEDARRRALLTDVVDDLSQAQHASQLELRGMANVLWCLARLGHNPGPSWTDQLLMRVLQAVQEQGGCVDALSLSQTVWALAKLGHAPPPDWMQAFLPHVLASLPAFSAQGLANLMWGLAVLQAVPPQDEQCLPALMDTTQQRMCEFSPQGLGNTMWAWATLGVTPPAPWLKSYWQAVQEAVPAFEPLDTSQLLWACARLGLPPPRALLKDLLLSSNTKMQHFGSQEIANMLWALAALRVPVKQAWMLAVCKQARRCMAQFKPQELAMFVWSLAHLARMQPNLPTVEIAAPAFFAASLPALQYFNPHDLADTAWALSRLRWRPPEVWMQALQEHAFSLLPYFAPHQCASLMCSLAGMRAYPSEIWMDRFFQSTEPSLHCYTDSELSWLLMALASLGARPPSAWMEGCVQSSQARLHEFSPMALCIMLRALARLQFLPSLPWRRAFAARAQHLLSACPQGTMQQARSSLEQGLTHQQSQQQQQQADRQPSPRSHSDVGILSGHNTTAVPLLQHAQGAVEAPAPFHTSEDASDLGHDRLHSSKRSSDSSSGDSSDSSDSSSGGQAERRVPTPQEAAALLRALQYYSTKVPSRANTQAGSTFGSRRRQPKPAAL